MSSLDGGVKSIDLVLQMECTVYRKLLYEYIALSIPQRSAHIIFVIILSLFLTFSVRQSQRRHLNAARTLIHGTDSSSTSPRSLSPPTKASTTLLTQTVKQVEKALHNSEHHQENEHTN